MDAITEFWTRLHAEWLPAFCEARDYPLDSFSAGKVVAEADAADFLRAMSFITVNERGQFTMPRSKAKEVTPRSHGKISLLLSLEAGGYSMVPAGRWR